MSPRSCTHYDLRKLHEQDQQLVIDEWLKKYHSYRPHQALGYLTPDAYKAKLEANEVALM
ncbi:MAG TPA: integrase core domain-containing protein [Candidatus Saccharimonadales bacterium]